MSHAPPLEPSPEPSPQRRPPDLERWYAAFERSVPPAPPFAEPLVTAGARPRWPSGLRLAAAAAAVLLALTWARSGGLARGPAGAQDDPSGASVAALGPGLSVDGALGAHAAVAGQRLAAGALAEAWIAGRVHVLLDGGAALTLVDAATVRLERGRAFFEVAPGAFTVHTPHGVVRVLGTRFGVDLTAGLDVDVVEGRVALGTLSVGAGERLSGGRVAPRRPEGSAWCVRLPALRLEGPATARPGEVLTLRLLIENQSQVRQTLPPPAVVASGALLSLSGPDGRVETRPLDLAQAVAGALAPGHPLALGPGERRSVSVSVQAPAGPLGAWRLEALYRPQGGAPLASTPLPLEIR